jgi:hypothetical protein
MSANLLQSLWERVEQSRPQISEQELEFASVRDRWLELGWLKETSASPSATCPDCQTPGCPIHYPLDRDCQVHPMICCMECGPVAITIPRRWTVEIQAILTSTSHTLGIRGEPVPVMNGSLWKLGRLLNTLLSRDCYFVRPGNRGLTADLMTELDRHPQAILAVGRRLNREEQLRLPNRIVLVCSDLFDFGEEGLQLDRKQLQAICEDATGVKKKPSPKRRDTRLRGISMLQDYMTQHVQSAKDHLLETGQLLPRPDQKILAQACRMTESAVSRCLNDPEDHANLLRMLWTICENPKSLRIFGAAKRRR